MKKRIAVLVTGRKQEALRVAVGLTLMDDEVSVFIMDGILESDDAIDQNIEALEAMNAGIYTNNSSNPFTLMSTEEIASALAGFDVVIPY